MFCQMMYDNRLEVNLMFEWRGKYNWKVYDVWLITVNDNFYNIYDKRWMIAKMTHINKIMLAHPIDQSEWYKITLFTPKCCLCQSSTMM